MEFIRKRHTPPMKTKASKRAEELTRAIEEGNDKQMSKMPPFKDKLAAYCANAD